jgi:hypothetical protein
MYGLVRHPEPLRDLAQRQPLDVVEVLDLEIGEGDLLSVDAELPKGHDIPHRHFTNFSGVLVYR